MKRLSFIIAAAALLFAGCSRDFVFPFDAIVVGDTVNCRTADTCNIGIGLYKVNPETHDSTLWQCTFLIKANCLNATAFCDTADCSDESECTIDICDSTINECVIYPSPSGCNDANLCTIDTCIFDHCYWWDRTLALCDSMDYCTGAQCFGTERSYDCVYTYNYRSCDDGIACTVDSCLMHGCSNLYPAAYPYCQNNACCNDGDACTVDSCENGYCTYTTISCDDLNHCTNDFCINGVCQILPVDCDDGVACTVDSCNPTILLGEGCYYNDTCNSPCAFDTVLTGTDWCKITVCVNGDIYNTIRPCNDGDACTNDYCHEGEDACVYPPVNCDDGTGQPFCCIDGNCNWGMDCCEDNNRCTNDYWNDMIQECQYFDVNCEDGTGCIANGTCWCDAILKCVYGSPKTSLEVYNSRIEFSITSRKYVIVGAATILGQHIGYLYRGITDEGDYSIDYNLPSGEYFFILTTDEGDRRVKKAVVVAR